MLHLGRLRVRAVLRLRIYVGGYFVIDGLFYGYIDGCFDIQKIFYILKENILYKS